MSLHSEALNFSGLVDLGWLDFKGRISAASWMQVEKLVELHTKIMILLFSANLRDRERIELFSDSSGSSAELFDDVRLGEAG
jgi:hypothetical protein